MALKVLLYDATVGTLSPTDQGYEFRFDDAYVASATRPVLGRAFEDIPPTLDAIVATEDGRMPSWFRNLLPEGVALATLKGVVESYRDREYHLLRRVGEDLPGAVKVVDDGVEDDAPSEPDVPPRSFKRLRVSLAGMQPKLSVLRDASKVTVPVAGQHGRWIAKLPGALPDLPENELAMLCWARESGIDVPSAALCAVADIDGLPQEWEENSGRCLLVERFDRRVESASAPPARIHQEDFAQILGLHPETKYEDEGLPDEVSYESIASIVRHVCGLQDYFALVDRLAFMLLSGNGDAHPKNWAVTYPDKLKARLAPAYDQVCTVAYPGFPSRFALAFMGELEMTRVSLETFGALAAAARADVAETEARVERFVANARQLWRDGAARSLAPTSVARAIDQHLGSLKL